MEKILTIQENVTTQIIEKKSKFIAKLFYVESQDEIEKIIKESKKQYFDARHHCIAYRILKNDTIIEKANDDGEPSGTAGAPMLKILQNNNLCNVLIIVIRYFGGTLLGTGGLVRAYSDSLKNAIEKANKIEKYMGEQLEIKTNYADFEKLKYYCEKNKINISNTKYLEDIVCVLNILEGQTDKILEELELKSIKIKENKILSKKFITRN